MPLWDPTHPGPLYQGGVGREEGRPSDRQDHHGATVPKGKAVQVMPRDAKIFLSRVLTVPRTERGKEYGRRFIPNLKVSSAPYFLGSQ